MDRNLIIQEELARDKKEIEEAEVIVKAIEGNSRETGSRVRWIPVFEAGLSRIWHWIQSGKEWAIVTSWKGRSSEGDPYSKNWNRRRLRLFFADLRKYGFGAIAMEGVGQEKGAMSYEMSFFIPNTTGRSEEEFHRIISNLAKKYEQFGYIIYLPSREEIVLFVDLDGDGVYEKEWEVWDYVSFTERDLITANKELVRQQKRAEDIEVYYSKKDDRIFQFQPSDVRRRLGLTIDPRALVGKRRRDKVLYYESVVTSDIGVIEGMGGYKEEGVGRIWKYGKIVRPFLNPVGSRVG